MAPGTAGGADPVPLKFLVDTIAATLEVDPALEWLPMQPGDVQHTYADVSKSERVLGYRPGTTLAKGVDTFVNWYRGIHEH